MLAAIDTARQAARERAWALAGEHAPNAGASRAAPLVIDLDATLITAYSEKEHAAPTFKLGYGFTRCSRSSTMNRREPEMSTGILWPGNAGSNTAADHITLVKTVLGRLHPRSTPELYKLIPEHCWKNALDADGQPREGARERADDEAYVDDADPRGHRVEPYGPDVPRPPHALDPRATHQPRRLTPPDPDPRPTDRFPESADPADPAASLPDLNHLTDQFLVPLGAGCIATRCTVPSATPNSAGNSEVARSNRHPRDHVGPARGVVSAHRNTRKNRTLTGLPKA